MSENEVTDIVVQNEGGKFLDSLKRNNRQIKDDRAIAISEDVELLFKRTVEDSEMRVTRLKRELEAMLDLSPENALNLKPAKDFDVDAFVRQNVYLGIEIYNEEIKLKIAKNRYQYLFGGE